ncbi:zinc ribbon domain-containing protein [Acidovorax sp. sif1233]|nr:zinc ribbon domain-containing protein [Acidovorax sp. sif1233]
MKFDRNPANVGGQPRSHFAFTGMLRCGLCGASLQTCSGTGRGRTYHYYGCRNALSGKRGCSFSRVRTELFDEWMLGELLDQVLTPARMGDIIEQAQASRGEWARERDGRRTALVSELRATEKARSNLYGILEMHGKDAPNLGDLTLRLRELNERVKALEGSLLDLENEPVTVSDMNDVDPADAAEVLRGIVMDCTDPKKLREFLGAFVKEVTVGVNEVVVDYHPECLVRLDNRTRVHSASKWLLDLGSNQGPTD